MNLGVSTAKLAKRIADSLLSGFCIIHFGHIEPGKTKDEVLECSSNDMKIVGDVSGKTAILVDDMADNCNSQNLGDLSKPFFSRFDFG